MISFSLDYHWKIRNIYYSSPSRHLANCSICSTNFNDSQKNQKKCLRYRQIESLEIEQYSLLNYFAYLSYFTTSITGPIATYNAWTSQIYIKQNVYTKKQIIKYSLQVIFIDLLTFQIFLRLFYVNSLLINPNNRHLWDYISLDQFRQLFFIELIFIWYKFLCIWRIPRMLCLWDDQEVPENMNRCMCNNYCFIGFWRAWHRGFNQWLIRYIFLPLGGSQYKQLNIWVIFTWVALWHDMNINLLAWAWVICLFFIPEIFLQKLITRKIVDYYYFIKNFFKFLPYWKKVWWKYVCASFAAFEIYMMVLANQIGFGVGYYPTLMIVKKFYSFEGIIAFFQGFTFFFITALLMFWKRENETINEKGF